MYLTYRKMERWSVVASVCLLYLQNDKRQRILRFVERKQTALITFMRHGEKDAGGKLTDTGTHQAKLRGVSTKNLDGDVLLFHSGVGRVQDTVRAMAKHLHMSDEKEEFYESGRNIIDYVVPGLHFLVNQDSKGDYHSEWNANEGSDEYLKH